MKNALYLTALGLALGLIGYLYWQLGATEKALQTAEQRFQDCQQVTFQLQNQLAYGRKLAAPATAPPPPAGR